MRTRSALQMVAVLAVSFVDRGAAARVPDNGQIESQIDEITAGREYDWLRPPKVSPDAVGTGSSSERFGRAGRRERNSPDGPDCGYGPEAQIPPSFRKPQSRPLSGDCGFGPLTGGESDESDPLGPDLDCGFKPGSCACDWPGGGSVPGGCGCGGIGVAMTSTGYLIGAVLFLVLIFLVARMIIRSDQPRAPTPGEPGNGLEPSRMRLSEVLDLSTQRLMGLAEAAAGEGDFKQAVGWAYLCGIGILHRAGYTDLRISTTNHQIIDSTRRRNGPHGRVSRLVRNFEDLFFGAKEPLRQRWEECKRIVEVDLELEEENPG